MDRQLQETPFQEWIIKRRLILDWYDGPREGFCELRKPDIVFYFKIIADFYVEDGLDDRLFDVRICDRQKYETLCNALAHQIGSRDSTVLSPLSIDEEAILDDLIQSSVESSVLIQSQTMNSVSRVWTKA
jgi:hypothetical protein